MFFLVHEPDIRVVFMRCSSDRIQRNSGLSLSWKILTTSIKRSGEVGVWVVGYEDHQCVVAVRWYRCFHFLLGNTVECGVADQLEVCP
jgi:hypothetical protein